MKSFDFDPCAETISDVPFQLFPLLFFFRRKAFVFAILLPFVRLNFEAFNLLKYARKKRTKTPTTFFVTCIWTINTLKSD
jgi:hypothetical protein